MGNGEKFTDSDLIMMVEYLYGLLNGDPDEKRLAKYPKGLDVWKALVAEQPALPVEQRMIGHTIESISGKYRRFGGSFHTVPGMDPEKVFFLYCHYKTKISADDQVRMRRDLPHYTVSYNADRTVREYHLNAVQPPVPPPPAAAAAMVGGAAGAPVRFAPRRSRDAAAATAADDVSDETASPRSKRRSVGAVKTEPSDEGRGEVNREALGMGRVEQEDEGGYAVKQEEH